jgi:hypothetical protein
MSGTYQQGRRWRPGPAAQAGHGARSGAVPGAPARCSYSPVFGDAEYTADEALLDLHDRPFRPELHYYVGGNSKVYGAALFRLLPADFGEVQHPGRYSSSATSRRKKGAC